MSFKILKNNCCGLDVHKAWIYACIGITDSFKRTEYKQARFSSFTKGLQKLCHWLAKYNCIDVCMESTGKYWIPVFNVLEKNNIFVTLSHPKYTKPQKGNKTDRKDAKWICDLYMCGMVKPSFIPPADIRQLRDLVRYRFKLTCMITGEKNRAHNCLTVSNLKLDDVFSDIFGKSSRSITEQILQHPGEVFDVAPFMDSRCKIKSTRISRAGSYFKPVLVQIANALIKSKKHPEFTTRYRRIKARRGHKKAIIAICRMILTAIWHILTDLKPYTPEGFLDSRPVNKEKVLTISQALNLIKQRGYIIKDDVGPVTGLGVASIFTF